MPEEPMQTEAAAEKHDVTAQQNETTDALEAAVAHRARILRRIGFAFFGGILVVAAGFLIYSTFHDIAQKTVYDPFTGENVMMDSK